MLEKSLRTGKKSNLSFSFIRLVKMTLNYPPDQSPFLSCLISFAYSRPSFVVAKVTEAQ